MRHKNAHRKRLLALLLFAPVIAGCSGASDMFSSDLLSKDAEWFSRSGRLFIKNVSIETPPLTPNKPVTSDDLVSAEGYCAGMPQPGGPDGAQALADGKLGADGVFQASKIQAKCASKYEAKPQLKKDSSQAGI